MGFAEFKRWLYRDGRPGRLARAINKAFAFVHAIGIDPDRMVTLEVAGRRSGRTISLPLAMVVRGRHRYLVSMLGNDAAWVRNLRATHGRARLRHGRTEDVTLVELPAESRAPILKAYLQIAPGARPHLPVSKDAAVEQFEAIAREFPVFEVTAGD